MFYNVRRVYATGVFVTFNIVDVSTNNIGYRVRFVNDQVFFIGNGDAIRVFGNTMWPTVTGILSTRVGGNILAFFIGFMVNNGH